MLKYPEILIINSDFTANIGHFLIVITNSFSNQILCILQHIKAFIHLQL